MIVRAFKCAHGLVNADTALGLNLVFCALTSVAASRWSVFGAGSKRGHAHVVEVLVACSNCVAALRKPSRARAVQIPVRPGGTSAPIFITL